MDHTSLTMWPRRALATTAEGPTTSSSKNLVFAYAGAGVAGLVLVFVVVCIICRCCLKPREPKPKGKRVPFSEQSLSQVLGGPGQAATVIPYETLAQSTNDFDLRQKIGDGRFGLVFQGELPDGTDVAVRRLPLNSRQGKREFVKGVKNMMEANHRNVVQLIGCCFNNARILVYENLPNGNLADALFDRRKNLDWHTRFDILVGTAAGLAYLHEEPESIFAHGDIKAGNIMLDKIMKPKIADWGLAALFRNDQGEVKPRNMVSVGYMSPELALEGQLSAKADVFSFGILCLEVVSGRMNTDLDLLGTDMQTLLGWAWTLQDRRRQLDMVDSRLKGEYREDQASKVIGIALLATQDSIPARPSMSRIVAMLTNVEPIPKLPAKPEAVRSLGLGHQNVSGTFTSSFVTPKHTTSMKKPSINLRWGSRKQKGMTNDFDRSDVHL